MPRDESSKIKKVTTIERWVYPRMGRPSDDQHRERFCIYVKSDAEESHLRDLLDKMRGFKAERLANPKGKGHQFTVFCTDEEIAALKAARAEFRRVNND